MAGAIGFWPAVVYVVVKALLAIILWAGTSTGYLLSPLSVAERVVAFASAALLIVAMPWTDEAGFAASVLFLVWHVWRTRTQRAAVA